MMLRAPSAALYLSTARTPSQGESNLHFSSSAVPVPLRSQRGIGGNGLFVCAAASKDKDSNSRPLTGIVFEPFEEVKKELLLVPSVPQQSLARHLYTDESEAAINEQIKNGMDFSEESTGVLKKAETEYKGHRSLLTRTRNLLSTMSRQDGLDRLILVAGFILFSCAVLYVVSKRVGLLKLQRSVTAAIKVGMIGQERLRPGAVVNDRIVLVVENRPAEIVPDAGNLHDEL